MSAGNGKGYISLGARFGLARGAGREPRLTRQCTGKIAMWGPVECPDLEKSGPRGRIIGRFIGPDQRVIRGVQVFVRGRPETATSDKEGHFELKVPVIVLYTYTYQVLSI